jgi:hypothetical protein
MRALHFPGAISIVLAASRRCSRLTRRSLSKDMEKLKSFATTYGDSRCSRKTRRSSPRSSKPRRSCGRK